MRYVYSVVRFVPDPTRGEFVNVGAIVGSETTSEWQVRQIDNPVRARAVDDRKSLDAVWSFMDGVGRQIDEYDRATESLFPQSAPDLSENWLDRLCAEHRNIVQLSAPAPMVAGSAEEALDLVFEEMIVDPAHRKHPFKKKHTALGAVRESYRRHFLVRGKHLRERVPVQTEKYRESFDFAVTDGRVLQLAHTWSFQVPDQDLLSEQVRAWGWTVRDIKKSGGILKAHDGDRLEIPSGVDVQVVYIQPEPTMDAAAMNVALNVFKELKVHHSPIENADIVGANAQKLLKAAGVKLI
jgi:hypothetical protein